ncbi:sentrin-specific protease 8-like [Patiria miniata]|uniref:Ubiquitin-like protease family profile domain-containing protein n=1 Tax=Patiria miniata TaxID=46514 RepID=A0A914AX71_PATMI|nr:sentrin-specific protease 8-like [Patiria miniata]
MAASSEQKVLSYHDTLLRNSDLQLLDGPRWLNDKLISFAFEYFEYDKFKDLAGKVAFVSPEVTQCIKLSRDDEVAIFLDPLDLSSKDFVFLAVNDHHCQDSAGGSHWSLLIFDRTDNKFSHYDSSGSMNQGSAMILCCKLHPFLKASGEITLVAEECPQQDNGYDCGLYVICVAEHLCQQMIDGNTEPLRQKVTGKTVQDKRTELKTLIHNLAREGTR